MSARGQGPKAMYLEWEVTVFHKAGRDGMEGKSCFLRGSHSAGRFPTPPLNVCSMDLAGGLDKVDVRMILLQSWSIYWNSLNVKMK